MYCAKCGALLPDDAMFCSKCGAKVSGDLPVDSAVPVSTTAAPTGTRGEDAYMEGWKYMNVTHEYDKGVKLYTEAINLGCANMEDAYFSRGVAYSRELG